MRNAATWIGLALALAACDETARPLPAIDEHFILVRLHPDPSTRVGEILTTETDEFRLIREQLGSVACDGASVVVVHLHRDAGEELASAALLVGTAVDATDLCEEGGPIAIQPASYVPGTDPPQPVVSGPLLIEGQTLDGRLPIGRLDEMGGLSIFPVWWQISGRAYGIEGRAADGGVVIDEVHIEDAEAHAVWTVRQMQAERVGELEGADPADPRTMLDVAVAAGVQPDVDADRDGRERFEDTDRDGRIDRCVDGDGTVASGIDCAADPRFADGFDLTLVFRLERAFPVE